MNDQTRWESLRYQAARQLPADFSAQVLLRANHLRKQRRELTAAAASLAVCIALTAGLFGWNVWQEHEKNLAAWQELSRFTIALEQTL